MSLTLATFAGAVRAEPWAITPRIGVSTEYATNPDLLFIGVSAEEHIAALLDAPISYDSDGVEINVRPKGRLSNSSGYSSLASDFIHLDANAQFSNDLGSTTVQGSIAKDSSLYFVGALANGVGVPRDSASTAADWTRSLSERNQLQLDASWSEVRYGERARFTSLVDYRYVTAGPTLAYLADERDTIQLTANFGKYDSLNSIADTAEFGSRTGSNSTTLQLGLIRQVNEIWNLNADAGYSRSRNTQDSYFGPFLLAVATANQDGIVYGASIARQGERFGLKAAISQALQPTGLAYLSRQESITLGTTYVLSERWDFALDTSYQKVKNPPLRGQEVDVRYVNAKFMANWHMTERWSVSVAGSRVSQQYGPPTISAASNVMSVEFTRQFLRTDL